MPDIPAQRMEPRVRIPLTPVCPRTREPAPADGQACTRGQGEEQSS